MRLHIEDLWVRFGSLVALQGVNLMVEPGRVTVVVGPNGAGKSTLMSVILGLLKPHQGRLIVHEDGIANDDGAAAEGRLVASPQSATSTSFRERIGYLPEAASFSANQSGRQLLRFFASARGTAPTAINPTLERVGLLDAAHRRVGGYSRGMRQRLGLAVAILHTPELLILDEPTGGLDQHGLSVLWDILDEWRTAGRTVLLSTHELALIERRADILHVIASGRLRASGTPDELREQAGLPIEWRKGPGLDVVYEHLIGGLSSDA